MKRYRFKNLNPEEKMIDDCTVRALSLVSGIDWEVIYNDLCDIGLYIHAMPSTNETWGAWLEANGWAMRELQGVPEDYSVKEFCATHPRGAYVLALKNHVVGVVNGYYYDTWDCGERPVLFYWEEV